MDNRRLEKNRVLRIKIDEFLHEYDVFLEQNSVYAEVMHRKYQLNEAVAELELDGETISQFIEDYVIQILKSNLFFHELLQNLREQRSEDEQMDFLDFRNLVHKNLGVARNLRIKDAQEILEKMMKETDLDKIALDIQMLEAFTAKLHPKCAYDTIGLIKAREALAI